MNHTDARNILELAHSAGTPVVLYGKEGIGKTGICRHLFPEARIMLEEELRSGGLSLLNSLTKITKTIIFENFSEEAVALVSPAIMNSSLYGEGLETFFVFTAQNEYRHVGTGWISIELSPPEPGEWLGWADKEAVHPLVQSMVAEYDALQKFRPRDLETLSKLLNKGVPGELLDAVVAPLVANNEEIMTLIRGGYDDSLDFEKVISLGEREFITRIKQTNSENIDRFNETLLQEIRFDESIITKEKLIAYISSMETRKSLELLSGLLESESSFDYLNDLLEDPAIKQKIDMMLGV
jgi:hypothetical protein